MTRIAFLLLLLTVIGGCRLGYVARVGAEHLRFVSRAVPISEEVARSADPLRRAKLELVLAVRDFAAAQGLDPGGSYLEVSNTAGLATAYVVTAAHRDRLEPYVWKYPVVGVMPYRGYFERSQADGYAAELEAQGLDTYVVEASGYSTLGWFDDPLPSGVLELDAVGVASFVLHELTHQRLFVPGEVDFNETLAAAVAGRLTEQFFAARGDDEAAQSAASRRGAWRLQAKTCDQLAARLEWFFAESMGRGADEILAGRAAIYADAEPKLREVGLLEADLPVLNNAVLLAWYRYRREVEEFEAFLDRFASVDAALAALEAILDRGEDVWDALSVLAP